LLRRRCSAGTLEEDPLISRIATILSTQPYGGESLGGGGGTTPRASRVASSGSLSSPLAPDVGHWTVRWGEIKVQRPIGRGSFGRVYQATWNATPVAVKVLIRSGARQQKRGCRRGAFVRPTACGVHCCCSCFSAAVGHTCAGLLGSLRLDPPSPHPPPHTHIHTSFHRGPPPPPPQQTASTRWRVWSCPPT
jgi:serine/threonine protein kinase